MAHTENDPTKRPNSYDDYSQRLQDDDMSEQRRTDTDQSSDDMREVEDTENQRQSNKP